MIALGKHFNSFTFTLPPKLMKRFFICLYCYQSELCSKLLLFSGRSCVSAQTVKGGVGGDEGRHCFALKLYGRFLGSVYANQTGRNLNLSQYYIAYIWEK